MIGLPDDSDSSHHPQTIFGETDVEDSVGFTSLKGKKGDLSPFLGFKGPRKCSLSPVTQGTMDNSPYVLAPPHFIAAIGAEPDEV